MTTGLDPDRERRDRSSLYKLNRLKSCIAALTNVQYILGNIISDCPVLEREGRSLEKSIRIFLESELKLQEKLEKNRPADVSSFASPKSEKIITAANKLVLEGAAIPIEEIKKAMNVAHKDL